MFKLFEFETLQNVTRRRVIVSYNDIIILTKQKRIWYLNISNCYRYLTLTRGDSLSSPILQELNAIDTNANNAINLIFIFFFSL